MKSYHPVLSRLVLSASFAVALAGLAACGRKAADDSPPAAAAPAAATNGKKSGSKSTGAQNASAKMNGYTQAYNKLIGTFGLSETHESYIKENVTKKKASDSISFNKGWVEIALNQFKTARALPGAAPGELDASADALIAALDGLVTQLNAMNIYYESKAYREDNLAKGKAQDVEIRAKFDASITATEKFNGVLGQQEKKANAAILAQLKSSGDMLGYNSKLALQQAQEVVNLFNDEKDIRNTEKYKQADALIAELDKTLAEQRQLYAAAKAKNANPDADYESVASNLVSMIGDYRDMKQSKQAKDFNNVVKNYNRAVESSNDIK